MSVFPGDTVETREDIPLTDHDNISTMTGYGQSKWVAERIVQRAKDHGLPVVIYRPGLVCFLSTTNRYLKGTIGGASDTGVLNSADFVTRVMWCVLLLGKYPVSDATINIAPVDWVAAAIVYLSQKEDSIDSIFHLINPHGAISWNRYQTSI